MTALSLLLAATTLGQPADETRPDGNGAEGEALDLNAMRAEDPDGFADLAMGAMLDTVLLGETERVEVIAERFPEAHEAWAAIYPDRCDDRPQPPTTGELPGHEGRWETGKEKHP